MRKGSKKKKTPTELDNAEKKYQSLIEKRDGFNKEANAYRDERNAFNDQRKKLTEEAKEKRAKRTALNKELP